MNAENPLQDSIQCSEESLNDYAKTRGRKRSEQVRDRVHAALRKIELEIRENGGAYPNNGGLLSSAEIARRAAIHPTTFFTSSQRALGDEVREWLRLWKQQDVVPVSVAPVSMRRDMRTRIADWKNLYESLAQSHRDTELQLHQTMCDLEMVRESLAMKITENEEMKKKLIEQNHNNVFTWKKRDK